MTKLLKMSFNKQCGVLGCNNRGEYIVDQKLGGKNFNMIFCEECMEAVVNSYNGLNCGIEPVESAAVEPTEPVVVNTPNEGDALNEDNKDAKANEGTEPVEPTTEAGDSEPKLEEGDGNIEPTDEGEAPKEEAKEEGPKTLEQLADDMRAENRNKETLIDEVVALNKDDMFKLAGILDIKSVNTKTVKDEIQVKLINVIQNF